MSWHKWTCTRTYVYILKKEISKTIFSTKMPLNLHLQLTLKLKYSSLNMHLCCNTCSYLIFGIPEWQLKKNDISMSLEFWDAIVPDHHGNYLFRHCSPPVLCNVCPNSVVPDTSYLMLHVLAHLI